MNHAGGWWPEGRDVPRRASWLPASSIRFDAYVDHLCKTWLGRAADARLQKAATQAVTGPRLGRRHRLDGGHHASTPWPAGCSRGW